MSIKRTHFSNSHSPPLPPDRLRSLLEPSRTSPSPSRLYIHSPTARHIPSRRRRRDNRRDLSSAVGVVHCVILHTSSTPPSFLFRQSVHLLETFVCLTDRLEHSVRERILCTYLYVYTCCCIGQRIERDRPSWRRALNHWALDIWTKDRVHKQEQEKQYIINPRLSSTL